MSFIKKILNPKKTDPDALENLLESYGKTIKKTTETGYSVIIGKDEYKPTTYNELSEDDKNLVKEIKELGMTVHVSPLMGINEYQLTITKK